MNASAVAVADTVANCECGETNLRDEVMRKMPIATGYTISMRVVLTAVAAMLITLMMPTQSDAEKRKPSGTTTTTTTREKCNRNYTACVGDCYLTHGTQGAETRQCTANCDHAYNRCMGPLIR